MSKDQYQPGKHIIASLEAGNIDRLQCHSAFRKLIDNVIEEKQLQKLGDVYHDFSPAGFTAVICLSESHISIHTWPEHQLVNLDIYLSNFQRQNDGTVDHIYSVLKTFFGGVVKREEILRR